MPTTNLTFCIILLLPLLSCQPDSPPFSEEAQQALTTFEVADGFSIELFASEPLVADPVAMEIDEYGRMYVVEMPGYPLDTEGSGKIKLLSDTNGDGLPDQSSTFAEGLILPTGIMRWKQGVIVTDAPDVWYLEDTTADGVADVKEVMLTGFARSNPQHNLNSPIYGLDNWIYLAHESTVSTKFFHDQFGGTGQPITFPAHPGLSLPVNADGRSVRFRPDPPALEMMSGESQYGHTFDPWGHQLLNSNAHHLFHEVLAARYLTRNPNLALPEAIAYLPTYGPGAEVYPITENPQHQLLTDVGTITSACGVTWYQGDLFPAEFQQVTFVAEPVHNIVHADVIKEKGATFRAERLLEEKEFLASTDQWFRPVNFYVGPDGALYVIDYYRQIIEHPEWMSEEVNQSGALYHGTNQGRIYRIVPEGKSVDPFLNQLSAGDKAEEELIQLLSHPNLWWRRTAQRLLVDKKSVKSPESLRNLVSDAGTAPGRVHALWCLEGLGLLSEEEIRVGLQDSTAGVRENAIKLAELHLHEYPSLLPSLFTLKEDPHPKVRFQLLCTLGGLEDATAQTICKSLLQRDLSDEWVQYAALSATTPASTWLQFAQQSFTDQTDEVVTAFMQKLGAQLGRSGELLTFQEVIRLTDEADQSGSWWRAALLEGLAQGISPIQTSTLQLQAEKRLLLNHIHPSYPDDLRRASMHLLAKLGELPTPAVNQTLERAQNALNTPSASVSWKQDALTFLGLIAPEKFEDQFLAIITPQHPTVLQKEALKMLSNSPSTAPCNALLDRWSSLTPAVRDQAINVFLNEPARMRVLLTAVEENKIDPSTVGWRRTVHLMNHDNDSIRAVARRIFAGAISDPEELDRFRNRLTSTGSAENGKLVFQRACATCHQLKGGEGEAFGPDLSTVRNRSKEAILRDIILPNQSIADGFELWQAELSDGTSHSGIIAAETPASLTLVDLAGNQTTISRKSINKLYAHEYSAMPEGLAQQISEEEMNDLLTYLKQN